MLPCPLRNEGHIPFSRSASLAWMRSSVTFDLRQLFQLHNLVPPIERYLELAEKAVLPENGYDTRRIAEASIEIPKRPFSDFERNGSERRRNASISDTAIVVKGA